jgi:hypothetical protein
MNLRRDIPSLCAIAALAGRAAGQPVTQPWPVAGPDDTVAVASPAFGGWYAAADPFEDSVEIRDINQNLVRTISRSDITALLPWMQLGGGPDGPSGLAWSDSGRLLFILVHDAAVAPDGQPSDGVLRYDAGTNTLSLFTRLELFDRDDVWPHLAAAHFQGRLYVGTDGFGGAGSVKVYQAGANSATGVLLGSYTLPSGTAVHGLAVDRAGGFLYAASESTIYRAPIPAIPLVFTAVGPVSDVRGLAYSDHYGGAANAGLYVLSGTTTPASGTLRFVTPAQASGTQSFAPTTYLASAQEWHGVSATADGRLLIGANEDAVLVSDASDTRLTYTQWLHDEFNQVVALSKGLISPDGEPPGWVIDADVQLGWTRFHPATPDGAGWAVLALLAADRVNADPQAEPLVRQVLTRYAGLAADGIRPSLTADGVMRHWIDPTTGQAKPNWSTEYATLSTMFIALGAARAEAYYPGDAAIQEAAAAILCGVRNQSAYVTGSDGVYFRGLAGGGPDTTSQSHAFNEGILLVEQLGFYGGSTPAMVFSHWLDRSRWPTATYLTGRPITGDVGGSFQAAFTSLYPLELQAAYRGSADWQAQVGAVRDSNAGWTDDHGPKYDTVFSAGTTRSDWGGYHADSLGDHQGDVTSLPALMAMCSTGRSQEAVAAYNAYRRGARQTFLSGASILYRRSNVDQVYQPDSAALVDVVLGGLGLAELLQPGLTAQILTTPYAPCGCYANCDGSTAPPILNVNDFACFLSRFAAGDAYANCDGSTAAPTLNVNDFTCFTARFAAGCP